LVGTRRWPRRRRDQRGLHILLRQRAAFEAHLVEDGADDVEARHQVGTAVADEQAHGLVDLGGDGLVAGERPSVPLNST
jgi:hypothetical protein